MMELCNLCQQLNLSPSLFSTSPDDSQSGKLPDLTNLDILTVASVFNNCLTCPFCQVLFETLCRHFYDPDMTDDEAAADDEHGADDLDDKCHKSPWTKTNSGSLEELVTSLVNYFDPRNQKLPAGSKWDFDISLKLVHGHGLGDHPTHKIEIDVGRPGIGYGGLELVQLEDNPHVGSGNARWVDPEQVDYKRLNEWIHICDNNHAECKVPSKFSLSVPKPSEDCGVHAFKVIDVIEQRIMIAPEDCIYVTLSYVWGPVEMQFQTKKANIKVLSAESGLSSVKDQLPATIKDAMTLVKEIGQKYLWVDNICIVQDDEISKRYWIQQMAAVYTASFLNIVAAAGTDSSAGLPGIRCGTRDSRQICVEVVPGLELTSLSSWSNTVEYSKYASRGWTFQERLLARRNLVFLQSKVYFECRQMTFIEEVACEDATLSYENSAELYGINIDSPFKILDRTSGFAKYGEFLEMYSLRVFSFDSDVLKAFCGIMNILSLEMDTKFICGHPIRNFADSLLWIFGEEGENLGARRDEFPSWAWSGWKGQKELFSILEPVDESDSDCWKQWDTGSFIWWYADIQEEEGSINRYRISAPTHSVGEILREDFDSETIAGFNQPDLGGLECFPAFLETLQSPMLRFWTVVAQFKIDPEEACLDTSSASKGSDASSAKYDPESINICGKNDMLCGQTNSKWLSASLTDKFESEVYDFVITGFDGPVLTALVVKWDAGIAERVGLAHLRPGCLGAALGPGAEWREVVMK